MIPSEAQARAQFNREGLVPERWSNDPHAVYGLHDHPYGKVLVVIAGSITFTIHDPARQVTLKAGDRLELAPRIPHSAVVGAEGVVCLEAHRAPRTSRVRPLLRGAAKRGSDL